MTVKYSLATALSEHSVPAVKKAIKGHGIIGVTKFGEMGSKNKDLAVIEHTLNLVAEYQKYLIDWWNKNGDNYSSEMGSPAEIFDDNLYEYHTIGWEVEPDFIDTNPTLARTDARQYRNQLILIAALCQKHESIDYKSSGSAALVRKLVEMLGQEIDEETVLNYLKQIPQALEKDLTEKD
jgi:hypothetical protein